MNNEKTTISLEMLLLNDLLRTNTIDKSIYDLAAQRILSTNIQPKKIKKQITTT